MNREARMELVKEQLAVTHTWQKRLEEELARLKQPAYKHTSRITIDGIPEAHFKVISEIVSEAIEQAHADLSGEFSDLPLGGFDQNAEDSELVICATCNQLILDWQFEYHQCPEEAN